MENVEVEKLSKVRELLEQAGDLLGGHNKVWSYISLSVESLDDQIARAEGTYVESDEEARYTNPKHKEFVRDMEKAGLEVKHYRGRFYYDGPSVMVENVDDVIRLTSVKVQWDSMGRDHIVVYPSA